MGPRCWNSRTPVRRPRTSCRGFRQPVSAPEAHGCAVPRAYDPASSDFPDIRNVCRGGRGESIKDCPGEHLLHGPDAAGTMDNWQYNRVGRRRVRCGSEARCGIRAGTGRIAGGHSSTRMVARCLKGAPSGAVMASLRIQCPDVRTAGLGATNRVPSKRKARLQLSAT